MGPVGLRGRVASRQGGVMDRIRVSGKGESLGDSEKASARVLFSEEAVPDCGGYSRTCIGAIGGANSDRGAGTVIPWGIRHPVPMHWELTIRISVMAGGKIARRKRTPTPPRKYALGSPTNHFPRLRKWRERQHGQLRRNRRRNQLFVVKPASPEGLQNHARMSPPYGGVYCASRHRRLMQRMPIDTSRRRTRGLRRRA